MSSHMRGSVFLTGATGFVGSAIFHKLLARGYEVRCLVRPGSESKLHRAPGVLPVPGDVVSPEGLGESMRGCQAVIHLVGIIREYPGRGITFDRLHAQATRNMVKVARAAGVRRYIQMSALGARPDARSRYHRSKYAAEEAIRTSDLEWTIFRPSVIFGPGDGFVTLLARVIRWSPLIPIIGSGRNRLQPVAVENVAEGFVGAIERPGTAGKVYEVGGPRAYSYEETVGEIGRALGRRWIPYIHQPLGLMAPVVRCFERLPFFPLTSDQLLMLGEDNVCDPRPYFEAFGITPIDFPEGIRRYLGRRG